MFELFENVYSVLIPYEWILSDLIGKLWSSTIVLLFTNKTLIKESSKMVPSPPKISFYKLVKQSTLKSELKLELNGYSKWAQRL